MDLEQADILIKYGAHLNSRRGTDEDEGNAEKK